MRKLIILVVVASMAATACRAAEAPAETPPTTTTTVGTTTSSTTTTTTTTSTTTTTLRPTTTTTEAPEPECTFTWEYVNVETGVLRDEWDAESGLDPGEFKYEPVLVALRYIRHEFVTYEDSGDQLILVFGHNTAGGIVEIPLVMGPLGSYTPSLGLMPGKVHYMDPEFVNQRGTLIPELRSVAVGDIPTLLLEGCTYPIMLYRDSAYLEFSSSSPTMGALREGAQNNEAIVSYLKGNDGSEPPEEPGAVTWLDIPKYQAHPQSG